MSSESALVAFPLHRGRHLEESMVKYLPVSFCAPLVIAHQEATVDPMPIAYMEDACCSSEETLHNDSPDGRDVLASDGQDRNLGSNSAATPDGDSGNQHNNHGSSYDSDDNEDEENSEASNDSPEGLTLSAWLNMVMQPRASPKVEQADSDNVKMEDAKAVSRPSEFDKHFLLYHSFPTPPSTCDIPVFCMAGHAQLSVLMTALLYQRRAWNISDPLFGIGFSKFSTIVTLYIGWLDDDEMLSHGVLVRF